MPLEIRDNVAQHALDFIQQIDQFTGNAVVTGLEASIDSGLTVQISEGVALVSGELVEFEGGTITLPEADSEEARKDVITLDSQGNLTVYDGLPEEKLPEGEELFDLQRPAPNDLGNVDEPAITEVFVDAGMTDIPNEDYVRDRRLFAEVTSSGVKILGSVDDPEDAVTKRYSDSQFTLHESNILLGSDESLTLDRFEIPAGFRLQVTGVSVSTEDVELEVFDETSNETVFVTEGPTFSSGEDLYTGSEGNFVDIRVVNINSDEGRDFSCKITYSVV